jgi:putative ABC transport system permease protein
VQYENNYESSHVFRNRIYRVLTTEYVAGEWITRPNTHGPLGMALKEEFPVLANATFLHVEPTPAVLVHNENPYSVIRGEAGSQFFEVFSFEFLQGSSQTAFEGERPIVISEDFAHKVFGAGNHDIVGQPIYERTRLWANFRSEPPYIVTAVVRIPKNTHIRFDALLNAEKTSRLGNAVRSWGAQTPYTTFVQLAAKAAFNNDIRMRMADFLTKFMPNDKRKLVFQPLTDIHLHSGVTDTNLSGELGELRYIFVFLIVALFVLLIGVINYVNLSIARGANRSREVGIRKAGGAYSHELIVQFMSESICWAVVAMLFAIVITEAVVPWFSGMMGAEFSVVYSFRTILMMLGLALFAGVCAGSYSAFYVSRFRSASGFTGSPAIGSKSALRKLLLGAQLAISIFIMLCTGIVYSQLHYIQNKDIGFDRYHVVGINTGLWYAIEEFKTEALKLANVEAVSIATQSPLGINHGSILNWEGKTDEADVACHIIYADWDYAHVFRLQMAQGRFIPATRTVWGEGGDPETFYLILNETAAKIVGIQNIFATKVNQTNVAGVVKDFNFRSFHERITPLIIRYSPEIANKVFIRINPHSQLETLNQIRALFLKFKTDNPFDFFYIEDEYKNMYQKEYRLRRIFLCFSLLSIFISCMGVFSLVAFMVEHRSKEIAFRKINGASVKDIVMLFAREFSMLTVAAFVVSSFLAWYAMNRWLHKCTEQQIEIRWNR